MRFRWMYRVVLSDDPTRKGVLLGYDPDPSRRKKEKTLLKFIPDEQSARSVDIWLQELPEPPVIGEDRDFGGTRFRAYSKMETPGSDTQRVEPAKKVVVKMPIRSS